MRSVNHEKWMLEALKLAQKAESIDEVPIGALVVYQDNVVGTGYNRREADKAPLAHAEVLAIQEASQTLGRWRLYECTLYVTLEPCLMCAGAIINARVESLIFGASDPKAGAVTSLYRTLSDVRLNHRPSVVSGILAEPCSLILKEFFRRKR